MKIESCMVQGETLGRLEKLAKISGAISLGMETFDLLAWGSVRRSGRGVLMLQPGSITLACFMDGMVSTLFGERLKTLTGRSNKTGSEI